MQTDKISGLPSIAVRNDFKKHFEQVCALQKKNYIEQTLHLVKDSAVKGFNSGLRPKWKS